MNKLIWVMVFPVFLILWAIGLVILILHITFDWLWNGIDSIRDKFMSWLNRIAPLE